MYIYIYMYIHAYIYIYTYTSVYARIPSTHVCPGHANSVCGAQAIEVLLKARAYVVKRSDEAKAAERNCLGQVTWSKYGGPSDAWVVAATRAGFNVDP